MDCYFILVASWVYDRIKSREEIFMSKDRQDLALNNP